MVCLWQWSFTLRWSQLSELETSAFISCFILDGGSTPDVPSIFICYFYWIFTLDNLWYISSLLFSEQLRDTHKVEHDEIKKIVTSYNISTSACIATALTTTVVGYVHAVLNIYTNLLWSKPFNTICIGSTRHMLLTLYIHKVSMP